MLPYALPVSAPTLKKTKHLDRRAFVVRRLRPSVASLVSVAAMSSLHVVFRVLSLLALGRVSKGLKMSRCFCLVGALRNFI